MDPFKRAFEKMKEGGERTDLPGHCKLCGNKVETQDHMMHDPNGRGPSLPFCSAECLYTAEHIFDGLEPAKLEEVDAAITTAEIVQSAEKAALKARLS